MVFEGAVAAQAMASRGRASCGVRPELPLVGMLRQGGGRMGWVQVWAATLLVFLQEQGTTQPGGLTQAG